MILNYLAHTSKTFHMFVYFSTSVARKLFLLFRFLLPAKTLYSFVFYFILFFFFFYFFTTAFKSTLWRTLEKKKIKHTNETNLKNNEEIFKIYYNKNKIKKLKMKIFYVFILLLHLQLKKEKKKIKNEVLFLFF